MQKLANVLVGAFFLSGIGSANAIEHIDIRSLTSTVVTEPSGGKLFGREHSTYFSSFEEQYRHFSLEGERRQQAKKSPFVRIKLAERAF